MSLIPEPYSLYLKAAGVAVVLIALDVLRVHLIDEGEDKVKAADAKATAAQIVHNQEVEASAQAAINSATESYKQALAARPSVHAPHVVCNNPRSGGKLPANASSGPVNNDPSTGSTVVGTGGVDIGPPVDKQFSDSDARVKALQAYIAQCQAAGICRK